ncbi:MAG: hypothetical protein AB8I40_10425 [Anaerolineales bacterium]|jgi:hypothetical protein
MYTWKDYYVQEQIRQERLAEAKQQRLVRMLSRQKAIDDKKAAARLLERVGYQLVVWGDALLRQVAERSLAS